MAKHKNKRLRIGYCCYPGCGKELLTMAYQISHLYCDEHRIIRRRELDRKRYVSTGNPIGRPPKEVQTAPVLRTCKQCGDYIKARRRREFCSDKCMNKHYQENRMSQPGGYAICAPGNELLLPPPPPPPPSREKEAG